MIHKDFIKLVEEIQTHQRQVLLAKNEEYASNNDKLANFKKGAKALGVSPEQCLWGYLMKHIISCQDIVNGDGAYTPELLREKAGDIRNYLILLEALMIERHT